MGRHSKEGDSQPLTVSITGRHRTQRKLRSISLTSFFRRSRHRPHVERPNEFGHTGADIAWSGTLTGMSAVTTRPSLVPVPPPTPLPTPAPVFVPMPELAQEFVEALMPSAPPAELDLAATAHLDPPTHYRRFIGGFHPPTIMVDVPTLRATSPARS